MKRDIFIAHNCIAYIMNLHLRQLEQHTGLGPTKAARLLGIAYVTYAQCRCGSRPLKQYHERHVQALLLLSRATLKNLIAEHVNG